MADKNLTYFSEGLSHDVTSASLLLECTSLALAKVHYSPGIIITLRTYFIIKVESIHLAALNVSQIFYIGFSYVIWLLA